MLRIAQLSTCQHSGSCKLALSPFLLPCSVMVSAALTVLIAMPGSRVEEGHSRGSTAGTMDCEGNALLYCMQMLLCASRMQPLCC